MTKLRVADEIGAAFPHLAVAAVVATDLEGGEPWEDAEALLAGLERAAAAGGWQPPAETDPLLASWHAAYRAFGTNPRRFRPSVDALGRRLAKSGRLPRVNAAVDAYNAVSLTHGVPAGAFDLAAVRGGITLRFATGEETFTPLGEPETAEPVRAGEVIYADENADGPAVLTRHWNHRDSDRTKVTPDSRHVVFLLETVDPDAGPKALDQAADQLASLLGPRAGSVATHLLTPAGPAATLG
ncbi:B3/B4 domain-containing protein [Streptomyces sp. 6N223]|uniref:B3/B4 domain-containing protein n=1 Tax=Streptomyces sp. 6N223 TaxID=3457412 RepID=UPI003FD64619